MWWVYHFSLGSHCLQPPRGFSKDKQAFTPLSQFLPWDLPQKLMKKGIDSTHKRLHKAQWLWLVPEWAAQDGAGCFGQTAWGSSHQDAAGLSVHIAHPSDPTLAPHEGAEASEGSSPLCRISDQPAAAVCVWWAISCCSSRVPRWPWSSPPSSWRDSCQTAVFLYLTCWRRHRLVLCSGMVAKSL